MKETSEISRNEKQYIKSQIDHLYPITVDLEDGEQLLLFHQLVFTIIDGKVCSAITDTSSQTCFICKANPTEMNDIDARQKKPVHTDNLAFGLSILHARIRFFEYFLHVS